ncbi:MAG: hypothetical protein H7Z37_11860 [Pyrinomonadaceae bacterium]|nr:hypothetical protein [Pyrinomonadaceae bacterium]
MVGEVFERDSVQTAFFQGGKNGFDDIDTKLPGVFDFKLWETSLEVFTDKKPMRALRDVLKYDGLYGNVNNIITLQNNHDTKRFMSLEGATLESAKLHAAFLLSTRGIPQLYYGEELAMRGGEDPDNRRDFSGGFPSDEKNAFTKEGRTPDEQNMFEWTQKWIKLRRDNFGIKKGNTTDLFYDDDVYIFERNFRFVDYADVSIIAINKGDKEREVTINFRIPDRIGLTKVDFKSLISDGEKVKIETDKLTFTLKPKSAVVYGLKP